MTTSSSIEVKKQGKDVRNVQLVRSDAFPPLNFQAMLDTAMKGDPSGALSSIPLKVLMIHDVRSYFMWKVSEIGDNELRVDYDELCENGALKNMHKHIVDKGLVHVVDFPYNFKIEWIKVILSRVYEMQLWLENWPVKITKEIIH